MMHICIILWTLHYTTASVLHYGLCITLRFLCYITIATLHYNSDTTLWSPHYTTEMCVTTTIVIGIVARDDAREFSTSCGNFTPKRVSSVNVMASGPNLIYKILFLRNRKAAPVVGYQPRVPPC